MILIIIGTIATGCSALEFISMATTNEQDCKVNHRLNAALFLIAAAIAFHG